MFSVKLLRSEQMNRWASSAYKWDEEISELGGVVQSVKKRYEY